MTGLNRRLVLAGASASLLGACAQPFNTATTTNQSEAGIGATGIVGTLTDLNGLIVNGLKIETGDATEFTHAFGETNADALVIGNVLTVEAVPTDAGLLARRVHVTHPVIGTVADVSLGGLEARVAGVRVVLEPGVQGSFTPDQTVAISGIWQRGSVVASRVDPIEPRDQSVIAAVLGRDGETGKIAIAGSKLVLPDGIRGRAGSFATVLGKMTPDAFIADKILQGRFTGAAGPLTKLSIEGFLEPVKTAPFRAISGLGHSFDAQAKPDVVGNGRTLFRGALSDSFEVERALRLPEQLEARRIAMRQLLSGEAVAQELATR